MSTYILGDEIANSQESQPISISPDSPEKDNLFVVEPKPRGNETQKKSRPAKGTGQYGQFRSIDEIDEKYRNVFSYPFFNLVQSSVIEDALYSDKSMVVCAPTGSGKTVVFEMTIVQLLMELEDKQYTDDFKIIYMAPVKALCTERLTEWYPKFTKLGLLCIEVTGDTDVDFSQLKPYRIIITTPEKWDMVTRRWREHSQLVEVIKLFLIDEVHILNDEIRGPVLEAVVSRMKTIEASAQSAHRIQQLQNQYQGTELTCKQSAPKIRFVAVSATVSNPGDVAAWLGTDNKPAVYYKFGDESRPVKLKRIVEGYPCPEGTSIFKFDIVLNYKLWPVIQKYHNGKPTLIFCNTRKSVALTAETLSKELTVSFSPDQKAKLTALASTIKNKKLQMLVLSGVGCHHAGLLYEERTNIEYAFRNRDLPILITTTTLAMGVNLPAHLVIIKNTMQYVNGAYQEYSISTILQMVGRAGRPQFDTEATAVIMTRLCDKPRYQALVGGSEPLQSYLHKRLAENLNSEAALGTVNDVAQCVQWVRSTFLSVRAASDPKRYLGLPQAAPPQLISKKIEELCVKAMNSLASSGLITMDEASCIEATEAGRLMSIFYLDLETMKIIMKINGSESLERLLWVICECHELADMHLRVDERRCLNTLNRNNAAATIRFPMKGKISTRQMKLNCIIQAILGCLNIPDPSLNQEAMKVMRIADRICKCLVAYLTRTPLISQEPKYYSAVLNSLILAKCITAHLWENSPYVSKQLKGIGPTFSTLLASAGKVNIMILEESHPRDLERIMNKGPPAGNVIRKQISLLPKYQVTMTPIDEKSVTVQLSLLNQNYLSENMEQLTAGDGHKSYIVVGDSDNNLLLLSSFRDKQLISVYDGVITHRITRKHSFEHKVFAHCISSNFVGIDAQCEFVFKNLKSVYSPHLSVNEDFVRTPVNIQTNKTDTYKERKRKSTLDNDITQSKEKKKRENTLMTKLKSLRESFGKTSRELKDHLSKSAVMSNKILQEFTASKNPALLTETVFEQANEIDNNSALPMINPNDLPVIDLTNVTDFKQIENRECIEMDDEKINGILAEIENEILNCNKDVDLPCVNFQVNENKPSAQKIKEKYQYNSTASLSMNLKNSKKYFKKNNKSNYSFLEHKNIIESDDEDENFMKTESRLSVDMQKHLEKYIQQTTNTINNKTSSITDFLIDNKECEKQQDNFSNMAARQTESKLEDLNPTVDSVTIQPTDTMDSIEKCNSKEIENFDELEADTIKKILQNYEFDPHQTQECNTNQTVLETIDSCVPVKNNLLNGNDDSSTKTTTRKIELKTLCQNIIASELNRENIMQAKNNIDILELNITRNNTSDEKEAHTDPFTSQNNFVSQPNQYDINQTLKKAGNLSLCLNANASTKDTTQSDRQCNNKYVYINTALSTLNKNTRKIKNNNNVPKQKEVCFDRAELFDDVIITTTTYRYRKFQLS